MHGFTGHRNNKGECRGGFDVTCQVLMIRGLNVNYYFAFDVSVYVREKERERARQQNSRALCVVEEQTPPPWLHPCPFFHYFVAQIMNAKRAHLAAGEGLAMADMQPASLFSLSLCPKTKSRINTKKSSACWRIQ